MKISRIHLLVGGLLRLTPYPGYVRAFTTRVRKHTPPLLSSSWGCLKAVDSGESGALAASGSNPSDTPGCSASSSMRTQYRDVVVIGGGLAGLSTALYLTQLDPERHVTILEKEDPTRTQAGTTVASFAAAGMLAPHAERLPSGPLLDLCLASRSLYTGFVDLIEGLAAACGEEGSKYLVYGDGKVGYVASGGFLAPALAGDSVATWAPPEGSRAIWLDALQIRELEPHLSSAVVGGWWFPEDASVDARRLTCALRAACVAAGVQIQTGADVEVTSLDLENDHCQGLWCKNGRYIKAKDVLVANGAWMRNLLPVPIEPHKGQSISLRTTKSVDGTPMLKRVLFGQDSYIVPKSDGRLVVGATVEAGNFDGNVTPAGLMHIISYMLEMVPGLKDMPIEETWAGLRPTTPDKGPVLGKTKWDNLYIAGGYWRNGVLLAPKTGQMMASIIAGIELTASDQALLDAFSWDRFTTSAGGAAIAAEARYAASLHPIHYRSEGAGVSTAIGTELGAHSTARTARAEREKDRAALMGEDNESFERAALLGLQDAKAFTWVDDSVRQEDAEDLKASTVIKKDGPSKYAVAEKSEDDLSSIYESIKKNQAARSIEMMDSEEEEARPDPGFRIWRIDEETGKRYEVPPYTFPEEMEEIIARDRALSRKRNEEDTVATLHSAKKEEFSTRATRTNKTNDSYNEKTLDGYQVIEASALGKSVDDVREQMRVAREKNRLDADQINEDDIGARRI